MDSAKRRFKRALLLPLRPFCVRACEHMVLFPPGHYYSPIPSDEDHRTALASQSASHEGIDLREDAQLALLGQMREHYPAIPGFPREAAGQFRFFYGNHYYSYSDTTMLACLLAHVRPRRFVDVGGGFTTFLMLDLNETVFRDDPVELHVIEPYPERLRSRLRPGDRLGLVVDKVQNVELSFFEQLQSGDVLFLDSTHVSKLGSDVNHVVFEILPRLAPGVLVHVHEIFFPFEYPSSFYFDGKFWNELYLWRAFLMFNPAFEVLLFNSYLEQRHAPLLWQWFPRYFEKGDPKVVVQNQGSSLWLRKSQRLD
jgi:hypothetical protein